MPTNIENKSIVVTGAGRGIGAEIARGLAADGARLTVADLSGEAADRVAAEIRSAGGTATGVDMANPMEPTKKPFEIEVTCP